MDEAANSTAGSPAGGNHAHPLRIVRRALATPGRFVRPWYGSYLLLGLVTAGMLPVLLPLTIKAAAHDLATVAYVMGAYNLGLLTSPLWGMAAERFTLYRSLFFTGFVVTIAATSVFPLLDSLATWTAAGFALGAGSAAAATVATLFVVDFRARAEWEPRIGLLQGFNGAGQVLGLALAAGFSGGSVGSLHAGLWLAAAALLPTLVLGHMGLPVAAQARPRDEARRTLPRHLDIHGLAAFPRLGHPAGLSFHFHHLNWQGLRRLPEIVGTRFSRFLLSWFAVTFAVGGFFTYFPLMLRRDYGVAPSTSTLVYAASAGVGIALFVLASLWAKKVGAGHVYRAGLALRTVGFTLLGLPFVVPLADRAQVGIAGFALVVLAWPILSVAGTALAARLSPFSEGAAMGLFNATLAVGSMLGAFASGPLVGRFGYQAIVAVALAGLAGSMALAVRLEAPLETAAAPALGE